MGRCFAVCFFTWLLFFVAQLSGQVLDKQRLLEEQTFWDNRDWDWYREQIPFFECPDPDLMTTYYYRWELLTKHLTYGSANSGYSFTEFIDRPFWSGAYGAISCPAGHQLYEARWLRQPRIAEDYTRYWFRTPNAQPRNYSTWLADAAWNVHLVQNNPTLVKELLPALVRNYEGWEKRQFVPEVGLFWQNGHDDGMEFNINSRQTKDILRGANGYRPSFNAYMWADAVAIEQIALLAGERDLAEQYRAKATGIKEKLQAKLWDPKRQFFFPLSQRDEEREGVLVKGLTLTYESGKYAGNPHGRELIGYVPWQFNLPDAGRGYETAWKFLFDSEYFQAPFGPTTVERNDPQFLLQKSCCWWSGQSWPYATTQTLKALANLLQNYRQDVLTRKDYYQLLSTYSRSHRKNGKPYLAEALHPDTGSFEGHDGYNHSEHYFHSGFCDLIITGLVGLKPRGDDQLEIDPLAPADWEFFALDDVRYQQHSLTILWDKTGERYRRGKGLLVMLDGKIIAQSAELKKLMAKLPTPRSALPPAEKVAVNFAVNNDGMYYPRVSVTHTGANSSSNKLIDGNYWYHVHPPNRWTSLGSKNKEEVIEIELGTLRPIHTLKFYFLADDDHILPPEKFSLEVGGDKNWQPLTAAETQPAKPTGRRPNVVKFPTQEISRIRLTLIPIAGKATGLTEIEAWGEAKLPVEPAPSPAGNLAYNNGKSPYPKLAASHTSRFDKVEFANDGKILFSHSPNNRWTSYESKSDSDWLEIDFGTEQQVGRLELYLYDDRGGVQAPTDFRVEYLEKETWKEVSQLRKHPEKPTGNQMNTARFQPETASKIRVVFLHKDKSRSGLTEIEAWKE